MSLKMDYDAVVIGGGFFGCSLALRLNNLFRFKVIILEREYDLLQHASFINQARVHNGYHYPRSLLTGLRSHVNYNRFIQDYSECIDDSFKKYYAIGKIHSSVNAAQFKLFCNRIGAPIEPAPNHIKKLFNPDLIEDVFLTREAAFDAVKLKERITNELLKCKNVIVLFNTEAKKIRKISDSVLEVLCTLTLTEKTASITAKYVFNCTYSRLNYVLNASGLPIIPLKHEFAELALIEVPESIKNISVTVMDGPFFSIMPFPACHAPRQLHSLSHVRYTPHSAWFDQDRVSGYKDPYEILNETSKVTNYVSMIKDAQRYMPVLEDCRYINSLWEIKTVLPKSESDDSRPILFKEDHGFRNLSCIIGAKIDNIYDVLESIKIK